MATPTPSSTPAPADPSQAPSLDFGKQLDDLFHQAGDFVTNPLGALVAIVILAVIALAVFVILSGQ